MSDYCGSFSFLQKGGVLGHSIVSADQSDGVLPQLPSVPLIRLVNVGFHGVEDCLCAALTLADGS